MDKNKQKTLFDEQELKQSPIMSPELWRIFMVFRNETKNEYREKAVRHFIHYGFQQSEKNSPEALEEIINFARKFRELRGSVRQILETEIFEILRAFISNSYSVIVSREETEMKVFDEKILRDKDEEINKAFHIILKIVDFIVETINYRPAERDVLDGGRKAMAVKTIETLLHCIKYPRLYDILIQSLLGRHKAAVLTALNVIFYNRLNNKKFKEALGILVRSSKDEEIRYKAEEILDQWEE